MSNRPPHILYVNYADEQYINSPYLAGGERRLLSMIRAFHPHEYRCHVLCDQPALVEACMGLGATAALFRPYIFALPMPSRSWNLPSYLRSVKFVLDSAREHQIDLIHANNVIPVQASLPVARLLGIPILGHIRGVQFRGGRWLSGIQHCDKVLAISRGVAHSYPYLRRSGRLCILYDGIVFNGLLSIDRTTTRASNPGITMGTAAFLRPAKGVDDLIRVADLAQRAHCPVRLRIAGDGQELPRLKQLIKDLQLDSSVTFCGHVSDMAAFLAGLDVFMLLSHREALGNSVIEAAASGLPCIVSDVGGLPETVRDGMTGFVVPPRCPQAAWDKLQWLIEHPAESRQMGMAAREYAAEYFSETACLNGIRHSYQALLRPRSGTPPVADR